MATSELIQWLPKIARATDEDIARFGPNAARVRALLDFIPGLSKRAETVAYKAWTDTKLEKILARNAALNAAREELPRNAAFYNAFDAAFDSQPTAYGAAADAAGAETVSDILDPQSYRILTEPLNVGRVYDLRAPEAGSEFMRLVDELSPMGGDDIERLADLSVDPRMQGILELLGGLRGGMPLAAKIDAARRLDRASRAGRRMQ